MNNPEKQKGGVTDWFGYQKSRVMNSRKKKG